MAAAALILGAPVQEADETDRLVLQLGDASLDVREKASRRLIELGARVRPAVEKAARDSDAERATRAQGILDRLDRLPEFALKTLARMSERAGTDYERLAIDLTRWSEKTWKDQDWEPWEKTFQAAGLSSTSRLWSRTKQDDPRGITFRAVLVKNALRTRSGLEHDIHAEIYIRILVDPRLRTRRVISSVDVGLSAAVNLPLADAKKKDLYPAGTILDQLLKEDLGYSGRLPILQSLEIQFGRTYDRHEPGVYDCFHLTLNTATANDDQVFSGSFTAAVTASDDKTAALEVGSIRRGGGHGSGPSGSDCEIRRIGFNPPKSAASGEDPGPNVYSLPDLDGLPADTTDVRSDMPDLRDEDLVRFERLKKLKSLELMYSEKITGSGLRHLAQLENLQTLVLSGDRLEDDGFRHLASCASLKSLTVYDADRLTDAGFSHLGRIASLQYLCIYGCRHLTDTCIERLSPLEILKYIELAGPHGSPGDWGLRPLAKIKSLERIEAWRPGRASRTDLAALAGMPALKGLVFYEVPLSNEGLKELGASPHLEELIVRGAAGITPAGLKGFLRASKVNLFIANYCPMLFRDPVLALKAEFGGVYEIKARPKSPTD